MLQSEARCKSATFQRDILRRHFTEFESQKFARHSRELSFWRPSPDRRVNP